MSNYKVIGIDLAKTKFHIAAINNQQEVVLKKAISRNDFFEQTASLFEANQTFAFEGCGGCHYTAQRLEQMGHKVILLKPKDVKPYAKSRQKNDINDAIAICKAALDPELMRVQLKSVEQQEVSYLHKARQNLIQQRIQRNNSLITSLQEFGYIAKCGKSKFAKECKDYVTVAKEEGFLTDTVYDQMLLDCEEIGQLIGREKNLGKAISEKNKASREAQILETIPGIGPINASILSNKPMGIYKAAKDFAASLGLVPKQNTTGGKIILGGITKQGDRYARTMLIQAARSLVMRSCKANPPEGVLYDFIGRLKVGGKGFNVICVVIANKLARIAYACMTKKETYIHR